MFLFLLFKTFITRQDIALLEKSPLRALIQLKEHHDLIKQCNHPCHRQLQHSLCFCSAYFSNAHSVSVFTICRCILKKTLQRRISNSHRHCWKEPSQVTFSNFVFAFCLLHSIDNTYAFVIVKDNWPS